MGAFIVGEGPMRVREIEKGEAQSPFSKDLPSTGADWHFCYNCRSSHHPEEMSSTVSKIKQPVLTVPKFELNST